MQDGATKHPQGPLIFFCGSGFVSVRDSKYWGTHLVCLFFISSTACSHETTRKLGKLEFLTFGPVECCLSSNSKPTILQVSARSVRFVHQPDSVNGMRLRTGGGLNSVDMVKARQVGRCKFALEAGTGSVIFVTPVVGLIWVSTALFLLSCAETCIVRELFIDRLLAC